MTRTVAAMVLLAVVAPGCFSSAKPPPTETYSLGISRANYRNYQGSEVGICSAEPQWLFDELTSVNGMLDRFVRQTAPRDGSLNNEQISLLEQADQTLEPVLRAHSYNLKAASRCGFATQKAFPEIIRRGKEYIDAAYDRLDEAPELIAYIRARQALANWREERPQQQISARQACPDRGGNGRIYFAYQDEEGRTHFLFCDGAKVTLVNGEPDFQAPLGLTRRELKRLKPKTYLQAAEDFPASSISRPPKVPRSPERAERG